MLSTTALPTLLLLVELRLVGRQLPAAALPTADSTAEPSKVLDLLPS